jgi:hypothetical protein
MEILDIIANYFGLIFLLAVACVFLIIWLLERRWLKKLEETAKKNGLLFSATLNDETRKDGYEYLSGFEITGNSRAGLLSIFSKTQSDITNIMIKQNSDIKLRIFEYTKITGSGKHRNKSRYTCIRGTIKNEFPNFAMRKENIIDKAAALIGFEDIDFERHPEFSKTYFLKSNNQNIKMFFNNDILSFFEREKPDLTIEAMGREFLLYKKNRLKKAEDYVEMLDYAEKIIRKFSDNSPKNATEPNSDNYNSAKSKD